MHRRRRTRRSPRGGTTRRNPVLLPDCGAVPGCRFDATLPRDHCRSRAKGRPDHQIPGRPTSHRGHPHRDRPSSRIERCAPSGHLCHRHNTIRVADLCKHTPGRRGEPYRPHCHPHPCRKHRPSPAACDRGWKLFPSEPGSVDGCSSNGLGCYGTRLTDRSLSCA